MAQGFNPELNRRIEKRVPPQNLAAERAVLAAAIYSEAMFNEIIGLVEADDFYDKRHGVIFAACLSMRAENIPIDLVTVADYLETRGQLQEAGGIELLTELATDGMVIENARHYANVVREKRVLREIISSMQEVISFSYGDSSRIDEIIDLASKRLVEARGEGNREGFKQLGDVLSAHLNELEEQSRLGRQD
ncbi:MAG: DnaB-like helicase N-terminal domain-containing protein, partial [Eubacteriales bacterium]|nr:DnaB-like helicase N-terminal domain-containing protein [Eubacteriales bacterium]